MERIQSVNPMRIRWCCHDRGISPEDLAEAVKIPHAAFQKMMAGEDGLTFHQLRAIAQFFDRGVLFFLEPGPVVEEQVHTPQFRTIANQFPGTDAKIKSLIERVEKQRTIYLSLREDMGEEEQGLFAAPQLPSGNPKQAAKIAREWLSLDKENTFDVYRKAVENKGLLVFRTNGYSGDWQIDKDSDVIGFSIFDRRCPAIVVRKQTEESRQTFTLMHELGHVLLHQGSFVDQQEDILNGQGKEREANAFAGHLLVPDSLLAAVDDRQRPQKVAQYRVWLRPHSRAWGVSAEMILRRLCDAGRLPQSDYGAYREWASHISIPETAAGTRQYRHREPKNIFGEPFVRTVLDALSARYITLAKASTYLDNIKIKDVHQLEHYLAGL